MKKDSVSEKVSVTVNAENREILSLLTPTTDTVFITASVLLEYLFCPRFIYFMNCLCIEQNEDKRYKVLKGREVHEGKQRVNIDYLRKRIRCVDREMGVYMTSEKYHIKGIVDEVLTLSDGTMAPLDYKYAEYRETIFRTQRYQSVFYGLLIKENYDKEVNRGFICYVRSKNLLKEIQIAEKDYIKLQAMIAEIIDITQKCYYPKGTKFKAQCIDCCYKNICI